MDLANDSRLLLFGSLKGGVGKTTCSLMAVEALVEFNKSRARSQKSRGVVLIDADIVGTEAASVVGTEYASNKSFALIDIIKQIPAERSVSAWIESQLRLLMKRRSRRLLIPSFRRDEVTNNRRKWRSVLEQSGIYVQRRMHDLVRACRTANLDVVVDLPAFDVGFATQVRDGLASQEPLVSYVTDTDVRGLFATIEHVRLLVQESNQRPAQARELNSSETVRMVVNRAPVNAGHRDALLNMLDEAGIRLVLPVPELIDVTHATRISQVGGSFSTDLFARRASKKSELVPIIQRLLGRVGHKRLLEAAAPVQTRVRPQKRSRSKAASIVGTR